MARRGLTRLIVVATVAGLAIHATASAQPRQISAASARKPASVESRANAQVKPAMSAAELEHALYAYADRYASNIAAATDAIARDNPSAEQRRILHLARRIGVSSAYDIATAPDPFRKLLDMVLMTTLQSYVWIDEDRAERTFGERAEPLIRTLRELRVDIWKLAAQVLRPDELQLLDALILDWRRQHPDAPIVSYSHARLDDVASDRNREVLEEIKRASGWFGIGEATKAMDEARQLGERTLFQVKRMPWIINWQAQAMLDETLSKPELLRALQAADTLARSAERISTAAEKLPAQISGEREAAAALLEDRGGKLTGLMREVRKTTESADKLALNVRETVSTVKSLQSRHSSLESQGKAFDIEPYLKASAELNETVAGVNSALARIDSMLAQRPWMHDLNKALSGHIDRLFWRALLLMAAFFVMLAAYRFLAARVAKAR